MSGKTQIEQFAEDLRDVTRSLGKKRYWSLVRAEMAGIAGDAASRQLALRAAASEVARLSEPSARIELNGHSASSLLRAIAEAAEVAPPAFEGVEGRSPDGAVVAISPFRVEDGLYAFAVRRRGQEATFVDGYFNRTAEDFLAGLEQRREAEALRAEQMAKFVADAGRGADDADLPSLADAILARTRRSAA